MRLGVIAAGVAAVMIAGSAMAHEGVEARQKLMKSIVGNVKAIGAVVKGQSTESMADVARRAGEIKMDADNMGGVFGDQVYVENANGVRTTAAPAIWTNWSDFFKLGQDMEAAAATLQVTAAGGDMDAVKAAFGAMTKTCGACHKPYRIKKKK
ncbi:MAG: cytochrome c [Alphaproteobacteria bacterium]|jgi:cytochrome c556|nr:cytochrome c [Alphaproteobacteria bacterium]